MKPILFSTDMVQAIIDGRKTVTRRIVKQDTQAMLSSPARLAHPDLTDVRFIERLCNTPCQAGDILYVRETWDAIPVTSGGHIRGRDIFYYKADGDLRPDAWQSGWRPSIHMPKEAARLFLRVVNVKAERLQDITDEQILSEGASADKISGYLGQMPEKSAEWIRAVHLLVWSQLWDSTIKKTELDRCGWDANPWVWVIEFGRCEKPQTD